MTIWAIYNIPGSEAYIAKEFVNGSYGSRSRACSYYKESLSLMISHIVETYQPDQIRFYGFDKPSRFKRYAKRWIFGQLNPFIHGRLMRRFSSDIDAVIA